MSGISMAPVTPLFVFSCSRQMSENHSLTDLCSSTPETPSTPTPKPYHTCGWKHVEVKSSKSSQAHAQPRHGITGAPCLPAPTPFLFLINPGLPAMHVSLACFLPPDLERLGLQAFETRLKGLFHRTCGKTPHKEKWLPGRKTRTCLLENHSCVIFFLHWSLPDYHLGQPAS